MYTVSFDGYTKHGNAKRTILLIAPCGMSYTVKTKPNTCYGGFSFVQGLGVNVRAEIKMVRDHYRLTKLEAV
jgi:hypothetical protein